ncbi:2OG-Fe(II) oxygenase, partial [Mesorhizobium sp. M1C.F.Ca.ET.187.01.1.1]|uniref:2OG-Fe(II) oxygenase n=1 Tax=Mesorhizobium sp. M1C.F.Ca.ET.187.01.1.1 TaxID=2563923 RepID=UPI001AEEBF02
GENGQRGGKSTLEKIRALGPAYSQLDDAVKSADFLALLGRLTGVKGLLYDPWYLGGGTHESRNGTGLDVHIDFNLHPSERWHRRLNMLIYLNPRWESEWGG